MDASQDDQTGQVPEPTPKQLADKYRVSWRKASEAQRRALCKRLGLGYTHVEDEVLLREVAKQQQSLYIRSKEDRQQELVKESQVKRSEEESSILQIALRKRRKRS